MTAGALAAILLLAPVHAAPEGGARDRLSVEDAARDGLSVGASAEGPMPAPAGAAPDTAEASPSEARYAVERVERVLALATIRGGTSTDLAIARSLVRSARRALDAGRFGDALDHARRAEVEMRSAGGGGVEVRPVDVPTTETIFRAETLLRERTDSGAAAWRLETARELVASARAATRSGDFTAAEDLARRAIALLRSEEAAPPPPPLPGAPERLDLNAASPDALAALPGMTPDRIGAILWWRDRMGPFASVAELRFLPGFDSYYVLLLLDRVTVHARR